MQAFPKISIIVPARNEAHNIAKCLTSLLTLDYPNFEIIVVDDGSSDNTGAIAGEVSKGSSIKVQIARNDSLPAGWAGKNNALHIGQQLVDGEWLLFTDADTFHFPNSLAIAVQFAQDNGLDFLSYSPEQECVTFWEKVAQPMVFSFLSRTFPLDKINDGSLPAAANGQYILVRREAYREFGGHEAVKGEILEDVAIARLARSKGFRIGFYPGAGLVRTRMYRTFSEIWNGWTKGLFPLLEMSIASVSRLIGITFLEYLLPLAGILIALFLLIRKEYIVGLLILAVMIIVLAGSLFSYYRKLCQNRFPLSSLVFFPLSASLFIVLLLASVYRHLVKTVEWKGRVYSG